MSRYLLDTHALLWYRGGSKQLLKVAKETIEASDIFLSPISLWEISLLHQKKKIGKNISYQDFQQSILSDNFEEIALTNNDFIVFNKLPLLHKDPFDRMLIAQALAKDLTLITRDTVIPNYSVKTLW